MNKSQLRSTYNMKYWEEYGSGWGKDCSVCKHYKRVIRRRVREGKWFILMWHCLDHTNSYTN
jgi:hypothetical protein